MPNTKDYLPNNCTYVSGYIRRKRKTIPNPKLLGFLLFITVICLLIYFFIQFIIAGGWIVFASFLIIYLLFLAYKELKWSLYLEDHYWHDLKWWRVKKWAKYKLNKQGDIVKGKAFIYRYYPPTGKYQIRLQDKVHHKLYTPRG